MEKEFVPYDRALKLKELGFDEPCFAFYICKGHPVMIDEIRNGKCFDSDESEGCLAPTFSQTFRWFREKYDMAHQITYAGAKGRYNAFTDDWVYDSNGELKEFSYEEAELACLEKLIEIVESKQKEDGK